MRNINVMDLVPQLRKELLGQGNLVMKKLLHSYLLITLMARIGYQHGYNHIMHVVHKLDLWNMIKSRACNFTSDGFQLKA